MMKKQAPPVGHGSVLISTPQPIPASTLGDISGKSAGTSGRPLVTSCHDLWPLPSLQLSPQGITTVIHKNDSKHETIGTRVSGYQGRVKGH